MEVRTIKIKTVENPLEGKLSVFEGCHDLPFEIRRVYYIYEVPRGIQRGGHAHKKLCQLLWCPYGSIRMKLDNGAEKTEVLLNDPSLGLIVEHAVWREMLWEQEHSVLCVAASEYYDETDYIRDYKQFLQYAAAQNRPKRGAEQ